MRDEQLTKVAGIVASLVVAAGALYSWHTGRLFPGVPVSIGIAAIVVSAHFLTADVRLGTGLLYAIGVGAAARAIIAGFPASMIGMDPDQYAVEIAALLQSGQLDSIGFEFYSNAPFFILSASTYSLVTDAGARWALVVYAIVGAIGFPLFAVVLLRRLGAERRAVVIGALLAAISLVGVRYTASIPIAQTLSVLYFLGFVTSFIISLSERGWAIRVPLFLTLAALVWTHKLGVLAAVLTIGAYPVAALAKTLVEKGKIRAGILNRVSVRPEGAEFRRVAILGCVAISLLLVQWAFVSTYATDAFGRLLLAIGADPVQPTPPTPGAIRVSDTLSDFAYRRLHSLTLVPVTGAAAIFLAWTRVDRPAVFILGTLGAMVGLIAIGVGAVGALNPVRAFLQAELLFLVIAVAAMSDVRERFDGPGTTAALGVLVTVLVISQVGTAFFVPDSPGHQRAYLSEQEASAKLFDAHLTGDVGTDHYYAHENPAPERGDMSNWQSIHPVLVNGTVVDAETSYVAIRDVQVIRLFREYHGYWRLTYDPRVQLDGSRNRIFDNGNVTIHARASGT